MAQAATTKPRLESGDRLSRDEFHRRYELRPDIRRAELIDGVVYVASPVTVEHSEPHARVVHWLQSYADAASRPCRVADNVTIRLPAAADEVQPDAALWWSDSERVRRDPDGYLSGTPELIVEVSYSSVRYDLVTKRRAYERAGVLEYVVWDTRNDAVHWFRLGDSGYREIEPDAEGVIESTTFPGLCVVVALVGDDPRRAFIVR